jgi:hypothetical protein
MEKLEKETPFSEKDSTHSDLHEKDGILADLVSSPLSVHIVH